MKATQSHVRRSLLALVFGVWMFGALTASALESKLVRAELGPHGFEFKQSEIRFGILNPLLSADMNEPQPLCRRNP